VTDIAPGDFVEAIRSAGGVYGLRLVAAGSLYRVREFVGGTRKCRDCDQLVGSGLHVEGDAPAALTTWAWCFCDFRPVHRPRPEFIAELLTSPVEAPNRVREVVS
jgi:hypothetical protein